MIVEENISNLLHENYSRSSSPLKCLHFNKSIKIYSKNEQNPPYVSSFSSHPPIQQQKKAKEIFSLPVNCKPPSTITISFAAHAN